MTIDPLVDLIEALQKPLSAADVAGGWTVERRDNWLRYLDGLRDGISTATRADHAGANRHLVRWLDHDGVLAGPLLELAAETQRALRERFPQHPDVG